MCLVQKQTAEQRRADPVFPKQAEIHIALFEQAPNIQRLEILKSFNVYLTFFCKISKR